MIFFELLVSNTNNLEIQISLFLVDIHIVFKAAFLWLDLCEGGGDLHDKIWQMIKEKICMIAHSLNIFPCLLTLGGHVNGPFIHLL